VKIGVWTAHSQFAAAERPVMGRKTIARRCRWVERSGEKDQGSYMAEQTNDASGRARKAAIIAVTSGKGGVGKTSVSVNMACEFSRRGHRTIIIDTDLGLANAHIVAGLKPKKTLSDYVEGNAELAEIIEDGPCKVKFISGGSGVQEMANLDDNGRARICVAIEELRPFCDVIILDTGAGVAKGVTDFVSLADHTVLVTTSNFASIADAYGIVKVVVQDGYSNPVHCVVNRVRSPEEADQVFVKLKSCCERFLGFDLNWLGLLPEDSSVEGAVLKRAPFSEVFPGSVAARYLAKLVSSLERYVGTAKPAPQGARS
jgi:flagellar biosynthesis protein FlhG